MSSRTPRASTQTIPFPKSTSSPTISSSSQTDSVSTWSSFSATTSHSSPPPPEPSSATRVAINDKKIKQFGEGWLTNPSSQNSHLIPNPFQTPLPRRARSPSVPILPSQLQPTPRKYDEGQVWLLDQMDAASHRTSGFTSHSSDPAYLLSHSSLAQNQSRQSRDPIYAHDTRRLSDETGARLTHPTFIESSPMLSHHQSVPNLSSSPRLRVSGQVRFPYEVDDNDDYYGHVGVKGYDGRKLSSKSMSELSDIPRGKNIYISSVGPLLTEDNLNEIASRFGEVLSSRIQIVGEPAPAVIQTETSWQPTPSRRCAFVLFGKHDEAAGFLKHLNDHGVQCDYGKEDFQVGWKSKEDRTSSNLYIQGLPLDTTPEELHALLAPFGKVVSSKFLESANRCRRGPALARLECRPQAIAAIKGLNHLPYPLDPKYTLQVRIADSEEQKDFKRKAGSIVGFPGDLSFKDDSRRASLPAYSVACAEAAQLENQKTRLLDALRDIEARQHRLTIGSDMYNHRSLHNTSNSSISFSAVDPPSECTRPSYHRTLSTSTMRTDRTASSTFAGAPNRTPSHPSTPPYQGIQNPMDAYASYSSLHHTTSTPDLGKAQLEATRRLWRRNDDGF